LKRPWLMLALAYLSTLVFAFSIQAISPVLSLIIADLNISHQEAGLLVSLFALPGVFLSIPIGTFIDRYGLKPVNIVLIVLIVIGLVITVFGGSFWMLLIGRLVAGVGAIPLSFMIGGRIVSEWFPGKGLGRAMGILSTAVPVGFILALNSLAFVGGAFGWRAAVGVSAAFSVIVLLIFWALYSPNPESAHGPDTKAAAVNPFKVGGMIWLVGLIWALFNGVVISFVSFAPDFFVSGGMTIVFAGFLASSLLWESPVISPFVGALIDRIGSEGLIIGIGNAILAVGVLAVVGGGLPPLLAIAIMGLAITLPPPAVYALPPKLMDPRVLGLGFGIVTTMFSVGSLVGPYLVGLVTDLSGSYQTGFLLMAGYAAIAAICGFGLYIASGKAR
jgi:predicted MFS family arabinose efflux permease